MGAQLNTREMVVVPEGEYVLGSNDFYPEEAPAHRVRVSSFVIDSHLVTNAQYQKFVAATRYKTIAEHPLDSKDFPGAPEENLSPGSLVFVPTEGPVDVRHINQWWVWTPFASWKSPEGVGSSINDRLDHPVVHIAYDDAAAYAEWLGKRLPTEAEWEVAARGGLDQQPFVWGEKTDSLEKPLANYYRGEFPWRAELGFGHTTPVGTYPSNGYGLYDMAGNVWEWTTDWYRAQHNEDANKPCCVPVGPIGGPMSESFDPQQPQFNIARKVIKGGSFLCADSYCRRYRPAARRPQMVDTGMSHIGFRCVASLGA